MRGRKITTYNRKCSNSSNCKRAFITQQEKMILIQTSKEIYIIHNLKAKHKEVLYILKWCCIYLKGGIYAKSHTYIEKVMANKNTYIKDINFLNAKTILFTSQSGKYLEG